MLASSEAVPRERNAKALAQHQVELIAGAIECLHQHFDTGAIGRGEGARRHAPRFSPRSGTAAKSMALLSVSRSSIASSIDRMC